MRDRVRGLATRFPLGFWLSHRKFATSAYAPGQRQRLGLRGHQPFWYVHQVTLLPRQTLQDRFTILEPGQIVVLLASSTSASGFRVQLYDAKRKYRFASQALNSGNFGGSATKQFFLRHTYPLAPKSSFLGRYTNLDTVNAATVQVVFLVYR